MTDKTVPPSPTTKKTAPAKTSAAQSAQLKAAKSAKATPPASVVTKPEAKDKKAKKTKPPKLKVVRDSFTLPQDDYAKIAELKQVCLKSGLHVKKSELIRAGLRLLSKLDEAQLHTEMTSLEKIKTGRPKSA